MNQNKYIPGHGPLGAKLLIVGENPSYDEMESGQAFTGPSGRELDKILRDAGINRSDCWITNVVKYFVPPNPPDKKIPFTTRCQSVNIDVNQSINELRNEINQINPNCILALGGTALWAVTGKSKISTFRGSILHGMGHKCVATYHPAHLLHQKGEIKGYWNRQVMIFDFRRAHHQSTFPELILPRRTLSICENQAQLHDFIQRNTTAEKLSIDIEASNCIPICVGLATNPSEGLTIPLWNSNGISKITDSQLASIWCSLSTLLADAKFKKIGQNFNYDRDKIKRLGFIIDKLHSDTMLKAFVINPELPKNLAFNTSIYTEEPYYKDEGMYEGKLHDLLIGCARDACVTVEIDNVMEKDLEELNLSSFYYNFIMHLSPLYGEIENNGLRVDESIREELLRKYIAWDERIAYDLYKLTGASINLDSPKQISSLLYDNLKIPERKGTGEEVLTQLLNNTVKKEEHRKIIELILEGRRTGRTIGNYILALNDFDNRMRTSYFICLETGRSSTNQQEPPIRPKIDGFNRKGKKKKLAMGAAFQTITKHGDVGSDVRKMYIPDEGEIFLQADSSQAEARVVALLANDEEMLALYDTHDIHALTASWFFGGSEDDYSKRKLGYESPYRFAGKTLRHAGHLGATKRRASIELNTQARKYKINFKISEAMADKALKIFHAKSPAIKSVFHKEVIECINKNRSLTCPIPYGFDITIGPKRTLFERWSEELNRQAFSHIPQNTVTNNTKAAALRIRARAPWIKILVESHDSLLTSMKIGRKGEAAIIMKEEFERPIDFSKCSLPRHELVIPCEIEEGFNYYELSKFKWMVNV